MIVSCSYKIVCMCISRFMHKEIGKTPFLFKHPSMASWTNYTYIHLKTKEETSALRAQPFSLHFLEVTLVWMFENPCLAYWYLPTWYLLAWLLSAENKQTTKKTRVKIDISIMVTEDRIWDSPNQLLIRAGSITVIKSPWGLHWELSPVSLRRAQKLPPIWNSIVLSKLVFPEEINTKLAASIPHHGAECGAGYHRVWDAPNLKSFYPQS